MGGKVRVHELAKEFGVPAKEILARLAADGEFAKSASSVIQSPVARWLRESFGSIPPGQKAAAGEAQRRAAGTTSVQPKAAAGKRARQSSLLTSADALDIYKRHRLASTSENPSQAVNELFRECEARYGIKRSALSNVVASEKLRRLVADDERRVSARNGALRNLRNAKPSVGTKRDCRSHRDHILRALRSPQRSRRRAKAS
jgi:Translation initiation factor IF-2, N-terminal region